MLWCLITFADLFTSAMQFCRGYDVYRFDYGLFPNDYGAISYYAWSIYLIIPFVCVVCLPAAPGVASAFPCRFFMADGRYELQLLVDWTSSRTSLLFEEWINVQQIMVYVFRQRCMLQYRRSNGVQSGRVLSFFGIKIWSGVGLLLVVVLILWGPLVLSVLIKVLSPPSPNPIIGASVTVSMNVVVGSTSTNYSLFSISQRQLLQSDCAAVAVQLNPSISTACDQSSSMVQSKVQVQEIFFNSYSDSIWTATPESRDFISNELKMSNVKVSFRWSPYSCSRFMIT
jgi:hypothetical protein